MSIVISNAFKVIEGRPVTSSRIVAEYFGKQHHHVVRDIRSLIEQKPSLEASANFGEWSEEVEIGSGAKRTVTETAAGSLRIHSDGGMRQTSLFRSISLSPMKGVCLSTPCAKVLP